MRNVSRQFRVAAKATLLLRRGLNLIRGFRRGRRRDGREMPFAVVLGEALTELPKDLYIPPRALEVFLEAFEGPLDLLLYLIRRQNLNILDIDVASITEQYMQYVDLMDAMQFELAAEYLLMAAMLAEIKSRMLPSYLMSGETEKPNLHDVTAIEPCTPQTQ